MGRMLENGALSCVVRWVGVLSFAVVVSNAYGFRFSDAEREDTAAAAERAQRIQDLVSAPCQKRLKNAKIMTLVAERASNGWVTQQARYGLHFQAINRRLRALGLKTYSQEEIRAQIAQAEIDAYFRNDPDAALSASKRLGAQYVLRGTITTHSAMNPVLRIPEVSVQLGFTLAAANGRTLSDVSARAESYSGSDTLGMALTLVNEQADELVARLYNDYCRAAGNRN